MAFTLSSSTSSPTIPWCSKITSVQLNLRNSSTTASLARWPLPATCHITGKRGDDTSARGGKERRRQHGEVRRGGALSRRALPQCSSISLRSILVRARSRVVIGWGRSSGHASLTVRPWRETRTTRRERTPPASSARYSHPLTPSFAWVLTRSKRRSPLSWSNLVSDRWAIGLGCGHGGGRRNPIRSLIPATWHRGGRPRVTKGAVHVSPREGMSSVTTRRGRHVMNRRVGKIR